MDKYRKLLSNTLILTIGTFASKLLVYFLMPLYTAILSTEQYGTADLITNAANLLIPFCCIGITHGVFRFTADKAENNRVIFSSGICVLLISSAIFLLISPFISFIPYFEGYAWLIALYVICSNFHTLAKEYIRAKGMMKLYAVQSIIGTVLVIAFNLLFLIPMKKARFRATERKAKIFYRFAEIGIFATTQVNTSLTIFFAIPSTLTDLIK